jgi:hypothetical protein
VPKTVDNPTLPVDKLPSVFRHRTVAARRGSHWQV